MMHSILEFPDESTMFFFSKSEAEMSMYIRVLAGASLVKFNIYNHNVSVLSFKLTF